MGIEHQKVLLYDRGYHTYWAEHLVKEAAEVLHFTPIMGQEPDIREDMIGTGIDGVEVVDDFEKVKDKVDLIIFPGEFDGEICDRMWKEGRCAFGSGMSAEIEINRMLFLEICEKIGLPPIYTEHVNGFDDAVKYFEKKGDVPLWVKTPYNRRIFDTIKYESLATFMSWIAYQRVKLGHGASKEIDILIQDHFDCDCEGGDDRYIVDGVRTKKCFVGYELKDKAYIYKVTSDCPEVLDDIDRRLEPEFKARGYRGAWSTEARLKMKVGKIIKKFTDGTARVGSPPGQGYCVSYKKVGQDIWDVANGVMPQMEETDASEPYGAILILTSELNRKTEVCVDFPDDLNDNIFMQHYYKSDGHYYCMTNDTQDGFLGAVAARGKTPEEAGERCLEIANEIKCVELHYNESAFDSLEETLKAGEVFGIKL